MTTLSRDNARITTTPWFNIFEDWNIHYVKKGLKRAEYFITLINKYVNLEEKNILDLGCGNGYHSIEAAKVASTVIALDVKYRILKNFKSSKLFGVVNEIIADAIFLPFRSNIFDVVVSYDLYEHVSNQDLFLDEVFRVVHNNGCTAMSTGNRLFPLDRHSGLWFIDYLPQRVANAYYRKCKKTWKSYDVHQPSYWSLKSKLSKHTREYVINGDAVLDMFMRIYPKIYETLGASLIFVIKLTMRLGLFKFFSPKFFVITHTRL